VSALEGENNVREGAGRLPWRRLLLEINECWGGIALLWLAESVITLHRPKKNQSGFFCQSRPAM